jgi:hypothetical protein
MQCNGRIAGIATIMAASTLIAGCGEKRSDATLASATATAVAETAAPTASAAPQVSKDLAPQLLGQWTSRKICPPKDAKGRFPGDLECGHTLDIGQGGIKCSYTRQVHFDSPEYEDRIQNPSYEWLIDSISTEGTKSTVLLLNDTTKVQATLIVLPGGTRASISGLPNSDCNGTFFSSDGSGLANAAVPQAVAESPCDAARTCLGTCGPMGKIVLDNSSAEAVTQELLARGRRGEKLDGPCMVKCLEKGFDSNVPTFYEKCR